MDIETERLHIKTEQVAVRIYTNDFEIEGNAHIKPGGYSSRVTDVLNLSKVSFLPITQARYRIRTDQPTEFMDSACLVVKVENIELIDLLAGES